MAGITEFILIFITLVAAVAGVVSNPSKNIKALIIALAFVASIGTVIKTVSTANENEINKKLIVSLVQASNPPQYFSHDLVKAINPLLENSHKFISGQTVFEDSGERIFTIKDSLSGTDDVTGVLYISKKSMNPIYYSYASEGSMSLPIKDLLKNEWTDCFTHWNECISELSAISKMAMEVAPIAVKTTTANMNSENLSFSLVSAEMYKNTVITIKLNKKFIESLYGLSPLERGFRILSKGQSYIVNEL